MALVILPSSLAAADNDNKEEHLNEDVEISNEQIVNNLKGIIKPQAPEVKDDKEVITVNHGATKTVQLLRNEVKRKQGKDIDISVSDQAEDQNEYDLQELVHDAYDAAFNGQLEVAAMLYKKALSLDKQNVNIQYSLATVYHKLNDFSQAKKYYNNVLSVNPKYFKALNNLLVLLGQENPAKALQSLRELAQINPSYSPLQAQIGMLLVNIGDYAEAERHLKKAVMLDPNVPQYKYNLAVLYDRTQQNKLALQLYRSLSNDALRGLIIPTSTNILNNRIARLAGKNAY